MRWDSCCIACRRLSPSRRLIVFITRWSGRRRASLGPWRSTTPPDEREGSREDAGSGAGFRWLICREVCSLARVQLRWGSTWTSSMALDGWLMLICVPMSRIRMKFLQANLDQDLVWVSRRSKHYGCFWYNGGCCRGKPWCGSSGNRVVTIGWYLWF